MRKCEVEGEYNFRTGTINVWLLIDYDRSNYMDVVEMSVWSDRRKELVPASPRLLRGFQEKKWDHLYGECLNHDDAMAEYYRDMRRTA